MKNLIILSSLVIPFWGCGQSNSSDSLKLVELAERQIAFEKEMREQYESSMHSLVLLKNENEELKKIMRGYVFKIDSLNSINLDLQRKLDECELKNSNK